VGGTQHRNKVSVEPQRRSSWHMDVAIKACGFGKTRGKRGIGCRPEILDGKPSDVRASSWTRDESLIVNNETNGAFGNDGSGSFGRNKISPRPLSSSITL